MVWYLSKEEALKCLKQNINLSYSEIGDVKPFFMPLRPGNDSYKDWFWAISINKKSENRNPVEIYLINPLCFGEKTRSIDLLDNTVIENYSGISRKSRIYKLSSEEDIDKFINFFKNKNELKKRSNDNILSNSLLFNWLPVK